MPDVTKLYWDIRLSNAFPTLEFRIADVCLTVDEAVMLAGLVRAIVRTCTKAARSGEVCPPIKSEMLKAAHWTAARCGLSGELIEVRKPQPVAAESYLQDFLTDRRPAALEAEGDWQQVSEAVAAVLKHGNGASRQPVVRPNGGVALCHRPDDSRNDNVLMPVKF